MARRRGGTSLFPCGGREWRYGRLHSRASDVISSLPVTSTLLGVVRSGYEGKLVEIRAVPVLD